jgi:hypothetical protein
MVQRYVIKGMKRGIVADSGENMLVLVKLEDGNEMELVFPHDLLPRLLDWSASGWNISAYRMGRSPDRRLVFDLTGYEVGTCQSAQGEKVVVSMRFGEAGSVSYMLDHGSALGLLEGLKIELEPEAFRMPDGRPH